MTMANEDERHRCFKEFMLYSCRYGETSFSDLFVCHLNSVITATSNGDYEALSSGSSAEFYIKPMLPCVGDIDTMIRHNCRLAIPARQTPPTELPSHFQRSVTVYEIIDSRHPGYVYLKVSDTLAKDDNGRHVAEVREQNEVAPESLPNSDNQTNDRMIISNIIQHLLQHGLEKKSKKGQILASQISSIYADVHGPAMQRVIDYKSLLIGALRQFAAVLMGNTELSNSDWVFCIQCLRWPPQADDWPTRSRIHGVPDQITVTTVVNNGCDVVGAVHPSCRQDEWMNKHQWRLSFSRAEVTLLNNWTPVQQIIYHMLRFVMKREVLSKTNDNDPDLATLSNYHIKTLMLWECEQKPPSWWSAESSLIKLCSSLLHLSLIHI